MIKNLVIKSWFMVHQGPVASTNNKKTLMEMAIHGEPKPVGKNRLATAINRYANSNHSVFDSEFYEQIKKIRPDWFVDTAKENKKTILEIAKSNRLKPKSNEKLYRRMCDYICKTSKSYDASFNIKIRELRPDWFVDTAVENKKQLIILAENSQARPRQRKNKLGERLINYTNKSSSSYDKEFDIKIRELRPDWFIRNWDTRPAINFLPFEEAREFARNLNLNGQAAWKKWSKSGKRPDDIPSHPDDVYKDSGWISWANWLGK